MAALALHSSVAAGLWYGSPYDSEDIGGNGIGRDAIGIDLIDTKVLAALQPDARARPGSASSLATVEGVAKPEAASVGLPPARGKAAPPAEPVHTTVMDGYTDVKPPSDDERALS